MEPTQPSAGLLQPTASIQFISCYFCGACITFFVSPKTASVEPAIDLELSGLSFSFVVTHDLFYQNQIVSHPPEDSSLTLQESLLEGERWADLIYYIHD